ncbi:MAG: peptidoglycan-binding domain-containing protein [Patescibacteria group bacterium]
MPLPIGIRQTAIISSVLVVLVPGISRAEILRNLRYGDSGTDVRELQQLLNRDPDTLVATTGSGSPGAETDFFGPRTLVAVKKFQHKYAGEILLPLGISVPTGFVGVRTRARLSALVVQTSGFPTIPTAPSAPPDLQPTITSVTPSVITRSSEEVTLIGKHFSAVSNTITVTSEQTKVITGIASPDGTTLKFVYHPLFADDLIQRITAAGYPGGNKALAQIVAQNIIEKDPLDGSVRIPFSVYVRNENGVSAPAVIFVDLAALLNNISE